jgi:hypothetical protein
MPRPRRVIVRRGCVSFALAPPLATQVATRNVATWRPDGALHSNAVKASATYTIEVPGRVPGRVLHRVPPRVPPQYPLEYPIIVARACLDHPLQHRLAAALEEPRVVDRRLEPVPLRNRSPRYPT